MKQGINLGYVRLKRGTAEMRSVAEAVQLCKAAGMQVLDYISSLDGEDYLENAKREREIIEKTGLYVAQTHCPYFRYKQDGLELFPAAAQKAVLASKALGAKIMVIHADEWPRRTDAYDESLTLQKNYELVMPVVESCLNNGILPAFENLFDEVIKRGERNRFCSTADELLSLLDKVGKTNAGFCLDTGHAYVSMGEDVLDFVRQIAPYVVCTHIHDNKGACCGDAHQPGCLGSLDLESIMSILKSAGYQGEFVWEMVYGRYPDALLPDFLKLLYKTGKYFMAQLD